MDYETLREKIKHQRSFPLDKDKLCTLHRELEVHNAHLIIQDRDDKLLKDVEFLLRSAIVLTDIGQPDDWKLQLHAAVSLLENRKS